MLVEGWRGEQGDMGRQSWRAWRMCEECTAKGLAWYLSARSWARGKAVSWKTEQGGDQARDGEERLRHTEI